LEVVEESTAPSPKEHTMIRKPVDLSVTDFDDFAGAYDAQEQTGVCRCGEREKSAIHVERYVTGLPGHAYIEDDDAALATWRTEQQALADAGSETAVDGLARHASESVIEMRRCYAEDRRESESCQAGTSGCSIDHVAERAAGIRNSTCETW
jgi:hypothetical protein